MKLIAYLKLARPVQWLKNLIIFFPPFLGGTLFKAGVISQGIVPFIAFGFAASSTYVLNDIFDRTNDVNHPAKKTRPIPAGLVPVSAAYLISIVFLLVAVILCLTISRPFCLLLLVYIIIQLCYTFKLKELAILDVFCISAGFVLRLEAGGRAFSIDISSWLFLSVFLLALFLSTGKRLGEMQFLGNRAGEHRKSLTSYPPGFLEGVMYMTGGSVMVTYTMFVISRHMLVYTVPLCCFGLLRYIYRVKTGHGGDPTEALTKDGILFAVSVLWAIMVWYGYYSPK
jgi:decaprenyl-phosphate phosphoribosyltransferase